MRAPHGMSRATAHRMVGTLGVIVAIVAGVVRRQLSMPVRAPALRCARCDGAAGAPPWGRRQ